MGVNTVEFTHSSARVKVAAGHSLLDAIVHAGVEFDFPCDGAGTCGKCRVKVAPDHRSRLNEFPHDLLNASERKAGFILACQSTVHGDVRVNIGSQAPEELRILSEGQAVTVPIDPWIAKRFDSATGQTVLTGDGFVLAREPGNTTGHLFGIAVDIGTTTLVTVLVDLHNGRELATASSLNPQARHAQDVLSRIKLGSESQGLEMLQGELIDELNRHVDDIANQSGISAEHIYEAVFSGNTTMLYLAIGADPASLGKHPYTLAFKGGEQIPAAEIGLAISSHGLVYLPPVMSAYVGADITSGILAARLTGRQGVVLFVDIGTNGEMVLSVDGRLTATSTAAGPAFEGMNITCGMRASRGAVEYVSLSNNEAEVRTIGDDAPVGICGSGLLDIVAELAANGGVDKNGRLRPAAGLPWHALWGSEDGKPVFRIAGPVYLSQKDVRQVQLAKAAIRAGIELMLKSNGLTPAQVDKVLIAGSFGFHLRTESLIHLGLLPWEFSGRVEFVGNTSRTGAQAALLNRGVRDGFQAVVRDVEVLELAKDPTFEKVFIQSLQFS